MLGQPKCQPPASLAHASHRQTNQKCPEPTLCRCAPTSLPTITPPAKVHPSEKKTDNIQTQELMPNTHTSARSSRMRKPTLKPTKGREPIEPKPKPTEKQDHSTSRTTPASPPTQTMQTRQEPEPR
ncbi:hypothetical protein ILYODFUR_037939 [Ilyodon furcidens]|uniref:Uncharacterized protein n=1 Tax=Ilyodon furcidens TaxID=33524 RepID=A0ABV0SSX2_9TELE